MADLAVSVLAFVAPLLLGPDFFVGTASRQLFPFVSSS
jgi:hypothetical protein